MATIEVEGIARLERGISTLEAAMMGPSLARWLESEIDPLLRREIMANFTTEGALVGGWAPLKASTQKFRAWSGFPPAHPINVRTGQMRAFVIGTRELHLEPGGASLVKPSTKTSWLMERKIATAQVGKAGPRATVPRPVAVLPPVVAERFTRRLAYWFELAFQSAVGGP